MPFIGCLHYMIKTKKELKQYLIQDSKANWRKSVRARIFGDYIWKYIIAYRKRDYYLNSKMNPIKAFFISPLILFNKLRFIALSQRLGFQIFSFNIGPGLSLAHFGTLVISKSAIIGCNCRIHEGCTIGATNGSEKSATIGDNVFIGSGAKIIGDVTIANDVAIGANAVVCKSIFDAGTTWGGVPAKKISDKDSHSNLSSLLELISQ